RLFKNRQKQNNMPDILVADTDKNIRKTLREVLEHEGYKVDEAENGQQALEKVRTEEYDLVLCNIKMPKKDGVDVLNGIKKEGVDTEVILFSEEGNIEVAVEAVRKGAFDFIPKPPDLNRLLISVRNALDKVNLIAEIKVLKRKAGKTREIIGSSPAVQKIKNNIERVAPTNAHILITGEN